MIKVIFYRKNKEKIIGEGKLGETLMNLCKRYKLEEIKGSCGGKLSCSTCHLLIRTPKILRNISIVEEDLLYSLGEPYPLENSRLSCQIVLTEELDGLEVELVD